MHIHHYTLPMLLCDLVPNSCLSSNSNKCRLHSHRCLLLNFSSNNNNTSGYFNSFNNTSSCCNSSNYLKCHSRSRCNQTSQYLAAMYLPRWRLLPQIHLFLRYSCLT